MSTRNRGVARGFTLLELLIVISIIVILASLTIPAVAKFLDGQALAQSGRIVQGAFNEGRQAAITQRVNNYLVFFRKPDMEKPGEFRYGIRRFRQNFGYDGPEHLLLRGTMFDADPGAMAPHNLVAFNCYGELPLPVFEGLPPETTAGVFTGAAAVPPAQPTWDVVAGGGGLGGCLNWVRFNRDGTLFFDFGGTPPDLDPIIGGKNLFDMTAEFDGILEAQFDGDCRDRSSINLRESGVGMVDERCFVDVKWNTGRTTIRVATTKMP